MQFKHGENYAMCTEKMYWPNANAKIDLWNFFPAISILSMHHVLDVDKIKSLVDANRRIKTREIAGRLNL